MVATWTRIGTKDAYIYSATGSAPYTIVANGTETTGLAMGEVFTRLYSVSTPSNSYALPSGYFYRTSSSEIGVQAGSDISPVTVAVLAAAIMTQIQDALMHAHNPIEVNLNVEISADSSITVLGEAAPSVSNVVVAEYQLPVNALYNKDSHEGLIEMWEPADAPGEVKVKFAETNSGLNGGEDLSANGGVWKATVRRLARGLQKVLVNPLDASAAVPFNDNKYANIDEYTTQRDFGRLALGMMAHYMFGHVDATVAITNDKAFVKSMLSLDGAGADAAAVNETQGGAGAAARFAAWARLAEVDNDDFADWVSANSLTAGGSASDANLAQRLTQAILNKGLNSDGTLIESTVSSGSDASLAKIVKQVIGQDAQRTMMRDGSERTKDVHQLVRFYEGDVIYVNIRVKAPTVTVGTGQGGVGTAADLEGTVSEQNYTIKITLTTADSNL